MVCRQGRAQPRKPDAAQAEKADGKHATPEQRAPCQRRVVKHDAPQIEHEPEPPDPAGQHHAEGPQRDDDHGEVGRRRGQKFAQEPLHLAVVMVDGGAPPHGDARVEMTVDDSGVEDA